MNSINNEATEKIEKNFLLLNSIHNINNENETETTLDKIDNNILIKFLLNPTIILSNKENLIAFISELNNFISEENNTIILPFLKPTTFLVQSYINSDLDETGTSFQYIKIFEKLINSSFVNRENLFPIFSFFSDLYSNIKIISQDDPKLKKIAKILELMKIFYNFNWEDSDKNEHQYQNSSICFIGGSLTLYFKGEISFDNKSICIKINLLNNDYMNLIDKEKTFLKIDNNNIITYKEIENNFSKNKIKFLTIIIESRNIIICFNENTPKEEIINDDINITKFLKLYSANSNFLQKNIEITTLKKIILLDNFFGQVTFVNFSIIRDNLHHFNIDHYRYKPISETNKGYFKYQKDCINNIFANIDNNSSKNPYIADLKITDIKFAKVNYVNYGDPLFPIIDYLGGIVQFLPFGCLIKQFYLNEKITTVCNKSKNYFLLNIIDNVLFIIAKCLLHRKYPEKYIKKYYLFGFCILTELVNINIEYQKNKKSEGEDLKFISDIFIKENIYNIDVNEYLLKFSIKIISAFRGDFGDFDQFKSFIRCLIENSNTLFRKKTYTQLYIKLMKELFIYNRMWSQKNFFFDLDNDKTKHKKSVKYKQINYYTKNFQQPLLYPILEISKYYPKFSNFSIDKLYKDPNEEILDYDFSLSNKNGGIFDSNNIIARKVDTFNNKEIKDNDSEKCCLIKKTHHIKGCMSVIEKKKNPIYSFELVFISNRSDVSETCNKENSTNKKDNKCSNDIVISKSTLKNNLNLCYGSTFICPKSDYGKKLVIKSKNILFIIIREYYHRLSAIEIFTINNKSYLFNFNNSFFNIKDASSSFSNCHFNKILEKISKFSKIEIKQEKNILLGFYNKIHEQYLYPLFSEDINKWNRKNKLYSNYDKLVIINLFSNRSFHDLHQYPIFPMFYKGIGLNERDMSSHIGLLDINSASTNRKKLFLDSYNTTKTEIEQGESKEELYLFCTHYSNPIYTCNYLLRVFPYSLISIEFQGNGFDDANRLFYSVPKICMNTLSQKSDLREMIPEMFYLPELFENSNGLQLNKIYNGEEIDNVRFTDEECSDKCNYNKFPANLRKYKFLLENREELETLQSINLWIDLIFGKNQKEKIEENPQIHQKYFEDSSFVNLENNADYYKNNLVMQSVDFGLEPFQLFKDNFPSSVNQKDNNKITSIYNENKEQFEKDHIENFNDPNHCFICKINPVISQKIIKMFGCDGTEYMNKNHKDLKLYKEKVSEVIFVGDVFGAVTIYELSVKAKKEIEHKQESRLSMMALKKKKNTLPNKSNVDERGNATNDEYKYKQLTKLYDHFKEIKYIDYNPRLNLFITYSLDGYLNIYTFPSIKMVRVINVEKYTKKNEFKKVVLLSNPLAAIFCYNAENYFFFSINGEMIKSKEVGEGVEFVPYIDKYTGVLKDYIKLKKQIKNKVEQSQLISLNYEFQIKNK